MMPRRSHSPIAPMTPPPRRCRLPLAIIEVRHVEVEVPSCCPRCGADFESEADCNLIEVNHAEGAFLGRVADIGGLSHFDVDTGGEVRPSAEWYPVRYECVKCRHVISAATARVLEPARGARMMSLARLPHGTQEASGEDGELPVRFSERGHLATRQAP